MTTQDVLELHRAGWSRDEILMLMQADRQEAQPAQQAPQADRQEAQPAQQAPQADRQEAQPAQQAPQVPQQVQQESETVQLLREMLGMIRGNNINTMAGETRAVDAAEILAANDYGFDKGGKT